MRIPSTHTAGCAKSEQTNLINSAGKLWCILAQVVGFLSDKLLHPNAKAMSLDSKEVLTRPILGRAVCLADIPPVSGYRE